MFREIGLCALKIETTKSIMRDRGAPQVDSEEAPGEDRVKLQYAFARGDVQVRSVNAIVNDVMLPACTASYHKR